MSDSGIIKEFLVRLGFQVDNTRDFEQAIDRAGKLAAELGTALEALAAAAVAAVTKVSDQFEGLYYSSQRVQATVGNIRSFDYAISQLGGTAAAAHQSLENFGDVLRANPAMEGMLSGLGIRTKDAQGHLRQTTDMLVDFGRIAKSMPLFEARGYAQMLGLDNRTLDALMRDPSGFIKHYQEMIKESGVDQNKAAEASARWAQRWRDLLAQLSLFTDKLALMLQGPMGRVIDWFKGADKASHGLSTSLIALSALLAPLLLVLDPVVVAILGLSGGLAALAADYQSFKNGTGSGLDWSKWADDVERLSSDTSQLRKDLSDLFSGSGIDAKSFGERTFGVLIKWMDGIIKEADHLARAMVAIREGRWADAASETGAAIADSPMGQLAQWGAKKAAAAAAPLKTQDFRGDSLRGAAAEYQRLFANASLPAQALARAKVYHDYLMSKGLDELHAQGVVSGMFAENTSLDPNAIDKKSGASFLGQWLGPRLKAIHAKYGAKPNWQQQLDFMVSELMGGDRGGASVMGGTSVEDVMNAYLAKFMRPGDGLGGDLARGHKFLASNPFGSSVQISQQTTIHVHGAKDPAETASRVASALDRVNANLVRHGTVTAS